MPNAGTTSAMGRAPNAVGSKMAHAASTASAVCGRTKMARTTACAWVAWRPAARMRSRILLARRWYRFGILLRRDRPAFSSSGERGEGHPSAGTSPIARRQPTNSWKPTAPSPPSRSSSARRSRSCSCGGSAVCRGARAKASGRRSTSRADAPPPNSVKAAWWAALSLTHSARTIVHTCSTSYPSRWKAAHAASMRDASAAGRTRSGRIADAERI